MKHLTTHLAAGLLALAITAPAAAAFSSHSTKSEPQCGDDKKDETKPKPPSLR